MLLIAHLKMFLWPVKPCCQDHVFLSNAKFTVGEDKMGTSGTGLPETSKGSQRTAGESKG